MSNEDESYLVVRCATGEEIRAGSAVLLLCTRTIFHDRAAAQRYAKEVRAESAYVVSGRFGHLRDDAEARGFEGGAKVAAEHLRQYGGIDIAADVSPAECEAIRETFLQTFPAVRVFFRHFYIYLRAERMNGPFGTREAAERQLARLREVLPGLWAEAEVRDDTPPIEIG